MWTPEFDRFTQSARRRPEIWRLAVAVAVIAVVWMMALALHFGLLAALLVPEGDPDALIRLIEGRTPTSALLMLGTFGGLLLGTALAARFLQRRRLSDLTGDRLLVDFLRGVAVMAGVGAVAALLLPLDVALVANTPPSIFLSFLPAALTLLLLQTGAEEIAFRGYLQTQLAARFAHPLVWMGLPSVLFGLLHYNPSAGVNTWWLIALTGAFGLVAADLTRVTGTIGMAWGLHFANNCNAMLLVSLDGPLSGLSLWRTPFGVDDADALGSVMWQEALLLVIVWAASRLWIARRTAPEARQGDGGRDGGRA